MPSVSLRTLRRIASLFRSSLRSQQATFTGIFRANAWGSSESVSGPGSTQARGADFQDELISLLDEREIRSVLDAPCGDFNWMRHLLARRAVLYTGVDIVEDLIVANAGRHAAVERRFLCADMTRGELPKADLVICRDGLVHLSFRDARAAVRNFRRSGSRYLLATTFIGRTRNANIATGGWRPLNLEAAPFCFPPPLASIDERCTHSGGLYRDKRLGLWELASLDL